MNDYLDYFTITIISNLNSMSNKLLKVVFLCVCGGIYYYCVQEGEKLDSI